MGFWGRLFGSTAKVIDHPALGRISSGSGSGWLVDEVNPIGSRGKPSLSIAGDENGPNPECIQTYQRLRDDWERIGEDVAKDIFELNQNYFSDEPGRAIRSPNEVWSSAELLAIDVYGGGKFSLTYRFDWQAPRDGHEITMYFENWTPTGSSVDG
jgi:hypothetical protein